jgi:hypothetical protein
MLTGHQDGSITHWRVEAMSAQALRVLSLSVYPVRRILKLRYSLLVITSQQLYHLDSKTLDVRNACEIGIDIVSERASLSPSNRYLVAPSGTNIISFEVTDGEPVSIIESASDSIFGAVVWLPGGLAALDSRGMLTFWN